MGWKDGSEAKGAYCSHRGPRLRFIFIDVYEWVWLSDPLEPMSQVVLSSLPRVLGTERTLALLTAEPSLQPLVSNSFT